MFFRRRNHRSCLSPRMRALMAAYLPAALAEPGVLTAPPSDPSGGATGTAGSAPGSVNA